MCNCESRSLKVLGYQKETALCDKNLEDFNNNNKRSNIYLNKWVCLFSRADSKSFLDKIAVTIILRETVLGCDFTNV